MYVAKQHTELERSGSEVALLSLLFCAKHYSRQDAEHLAASIAQIITLLCDLRLATACSAYYICILWLIAQVITSSATQFIPTSPETSVTLLSFPGSSGTRIRRYALQPDGRVEARRSAQKPDSPSQIPARRCQLPCRWRQSQ